MRVWELPEVPEHYIEEARTIINAREQAGWERLGKYEKVQPSLSLDIIGEF